MAAKRNHDALYEDDYYAWILDQVRALRERRLEEVDWENVAEEIEVLAKNERRALESQVARMLEHLLKLTYSHGVFRDYNARGWRLSIKGARLAAHKLLKESPSLRPALVDMLADAYQAGRLEALREPSLVEDDLPQSCPWALEQLMDDSFPPDGK